MFSDSEEVNPRATLLACFQQALAAVNGRQSVVNYFSQHSIPWDKQIALIAIGKAATSMAEGAVEALAEQIETGLVVGKAPCGFNSEEKWQRFRIIESSHPVPDERSLAAGRELVAFIEALPESMPVLFLVSGGTSALVELLVEGVSLDDLRSVNETMLANGMGIKEMNRVRTHMSRIKGGRLLAYLDKHPALNLLISDVPGDELSVIGSGLLVPGEPDGDLPLPLPEAINHILNKAAPTTDDISSHIPVENVIVASNRLAREAAASEAERQGYPVFMHDPLLTGEVTEVANQLFSYIQSAEKGIHIWGAEPVVYLPENPGRGGRNQHLALLLADRIKGLDNLHILVAATDGSDGMTDDSGGLVDGKTVERGEQEGLSAKECIARADAGVFLEASGDLLSTGPTGSNVMDLVFICKT